MLKERKCVSVCVCVCVCAHACMCVHACVSRGGGGGGGGGRTTTLHGTHNIYICVFFSAFKFNCCRMAMAKDIADSTLLFIFS